jgi:hypothetical protein
MFLHRLQCMVNPLDLAPRSNFRPHLDDQILGCVKLLLLCILPWKLYTLLARPLLITIIIIVITIQSLINRRRRLSL